MGQRSQTLAFAPTANGLAVAIPGNANLLPRGYYMLFILNDDGVPSISKIINIGGEIDGLRYIASYSELIMAFGTNEVAGQQHYQTYGRAEGRNPFLFNPSQYLANYPDLRAAFGTDVRAAETHFIQSGYFEYRTDKPL